MKKILLMSVLGLLVFGFASTSQVHADVRCMGKPGIQLWENANKGGGTFRWCWATPTSASIPDLSVITSGLGWGANWDNRISSYETFNFSGHSVRLYPGKQYGGTAYLTTSGNEYVRDVSIYWVTKDNLDGFDDTASSIKKLY